MSFSYSPSVASKKFVLTRIKASAKEAPNFKFASFDLETADLAGGPVRMAQLAHESWGDAKLFYGPTAAAQMLEFIFGLDPKHNQKTIWYTHNAEFDWRYLVEPFEKLCPDYFMVPVERCQNNHYEIKIFHKTERTAKGEPVLITRFRDSSAVYAGKMEKLLKGFAPSHLHKRDIGLDRGVKFDENNSEHVEYAKVDVLGLVAALKKFDRTIWENFGVHLKGTSASTAFAAWQVTITEDEYHYQADVAATSFIRKCYFGGMVQINAPVNVAVPSVITLDRNSSYPAAMRLGVPFGRPRYTSSFKDGFPGFYRVIAHVPEMILPIVPYRSADGGVSWPTGNFETFISTIEIEYMRTRAQRLRYSRVIIFRKG